MIRPVPFLGISAILVVLIWYLGGALPPTDPFARSDPFSSHKLDRLSGQSLAELKIRHAHRYKQYDVGLFGNSRSLNVSKGDIGIDGCSFFNFSVGSESLRSSVAFLEILAAVDRAPRIALVSVDHFELQRYNNPLFPSAVARWRLLARDLWAGVRRRDISSLELARMTWRHAIIEYRLFKEVFEIEFVISGVKNLLGISEAPSAPGADNAFYRADGSRSPSAAILRPRPKGLLSPGSPQIMFGYLKYDLERLLKLQERGLRVILFETFIDPESARFFADNPSPYAKATRARFLTLCGELSLSCHTAPDNIPFSGMAWVDNSHPPGKSTGSHIRKLMAEDARQCIRDL